MRCIGPCAEEISWHRRGHVEHQDIETASEEAQAEQETGNYSQER